jgi:hypothetical protein
MLGGFVNQVKGCKSAYEVDMVISKARRLLPRDEMVQLIDEALIVLKAMYDEC